MRKPRMTKSEKTWVKAQVIDSLQGEDLVKFLTLITTKTYQWWQGDTPDSVGLAPVDNFDLPVDNSVINTLQLFSRLSACRVDKCLWCVVSYWYEEITNDQDREGFCPRKQANGT